jgi:galactokinase
VAWALPSARAAAGWDGAIESTIPAGASLSSSAALEIAAGLVFDQVAGTSTDRTQLALAAQRAEQEWVGMACGVMDQLTVASAQAGHALLLDCRSLEREQVPVPRDVVFVVLDTSTRRELTSSAYNDRRAACERVAARLGVPALRDVDADEVQRRWDDLDPTDARRARHVVTENARVLAAADALRAGDIAAFGALMTESHESLRDDFESSSPELDAIVEAAVAAPGCHGARVTGAGFAGCAVAAVDAGRLEPFRATTSSVFTEATGLAPELYPCVPSRGARVSAA